MADLTAVIVKRRKAVLLWLLAGGAVLGLILLYGMLTGWQSPLDREMLRDFLQQAQATPFALPAVVMVYIVAHAVLFPVTVLNLITAMVFGPLWGVFYGLAGALASAALYFGLGALPGRRYLRRLMGERARKIDAQFANSGVIGVMMIRLVPVAPYTVVNLAAGVSSVKFYEFLLGTLLALLPGAAARGLVGDSLTRIILDPMPQTALYLGGGLLFWAAVVYGTFRFARWLKRRQGKNSRTIRQRHGKLK